MSDNNPFVLKTKNALIDNFDVKRLSSGFDLSDNDIGGDCILFIGLNPAGSVEDAERESSNLIHFYLYSVESKIRKSSKWFYNEYFGQLYNFANKITNNDCKWPWCNLDIKTITDEIDNNQELDVFKQDILEQYNSSKNRRYTLYVGDMFYYHETNSHAIPFKNWDDNEYYDYCVSMLIEHINILKRHKKNIKFIYINSAKVSHWLCNGKTCTSSEYEGIMTFYGGMLSGQRAMDLFSKERLINEIKSHLE